MRHAVQLFTLRDQLGADPAGTLAALSDMGYRSVETAGTLGLSVARFRDLLDQAGLAVVGCHVGLDDAEGRTAEVVEEAKTLGAEWLVVPWVGSDAYADGWGALGARLGEVARRVLASGLRFAYHNHDFEFQASNGRTGFDQLWEGAPETVEAELDLYWVHHAGDDPAAWLRRLSGRVPLAHFKDGKGGGHVPVGEGELDWPLIVEAARTVGLEWAIVELDECPRDPLDCVRASLETLQKLGVRP